MSQDNKQQEEGQGQQDYTDQQFREVLNDLIVGLEDDDHNLTNVRREYFLDMLRRRAGIDVIKIEGNVIFYKFLGRKKYNKYNK